MRTLLTSYYASRVIVDSDCWQGPPIFSAKYLSCFLLVLLNPITVSTDRVGLVNFLNRVFPAFAMHPSQLHIRS